ncbi:MAG: glutamine synthetase [Alphaproteobacteria bacterium]|nr:glutamine synthetase [Alphaproteobacteria bacterium]
MSSGFIARHGLWDDDQAACAAELRKRAETEQLRLIRMVWADSHGQARAKAVSLPVFLASLTDGYNINVATFTLDSSGGRVFRSFVRGGGMGLDEMTGSPNLTIVPDPTTFRTLPWAPGTGWVLCDEYFTDGRPFHFSSRSILSRQLGRLRNSGMELIVGLEVEWYLRRIDGTLTDDHIGAPGSHARPLQTAPVEPGYSYHSESNMDLMQPVIDALAETYQQLGLPLRSIENEYGPGQLECTFAARPAMQSADDYVLFRTATRQVCRRLGYFATFMCRPSFPGLCASGWHLHQSLADAGTGRNLFMPDSGEAPLSPLGMAYLAGLLTHATPAAVFATPTVNGFRRFQPNSLAPDRVTWSHDHRGAMLRVLGGARDPATRFENRIGEPAANPYLFIASQIVAGLDGIERNAAPWPADDEPYEADRPRLPTSLGAALEALGASALFREQLGDLYCDYYISLKRAELDRYLQSVAGDPSPPEVNGVSAWEQNEYVDFF